MNILYNYTAYNANRIHKNTQNQLAKVTGKLSSGYQINSAADDAASLSISEKMRSQIRSLKKAEQNIEDGSSYCQVADGALAEVQSMLQRINELAIQSSNDSNTDNDRNALNEEIQQIKDGIEQIFDTTEFNTKKIWDSNANGQKQISSTRKQALTLKTSNATIKLDETNKDAIAVNGYKINVKGTDASDPSTYGFTVSWTGYNSQNYETSLIAWPELSNHSFSVNIGDYLDKTAHPELEKFNYTIAWTTAEGCTAQDMADSLKNVTFTCGENSSESISITTNGQSINPNSNSYGITFSFSTGYLLELASGRNADQYDTAWIEPSIASGSSTNVISQPTYTDPTEDTGWQIQFEVANVGIVTATSTTVIYDSTDRSDATKGIWWHDTVLNQATGQTRKDGNSYVASTGANGSLNRVLSCLNMPNNTAYNLSSVGGTISVTFNVTGPKYSYNGNSSSNYSIMTMAISVAQGETADSVMSRIQSVLNDTTVFDIYEGNPTTNAASPMYGYIYANTAKTHIINSPIYGKADNTLMIQSGSRGYDGIAITYDALRLSVLGLTDTDISTYEGSQKAIDEVASALDIVSAQRSLFGAYQNRLEHAQNVDANIEENTQSSESSLRDADIAALVVENARNNILMQVSESMISNSNHNWESALSLLQ